MMRPTVQGALLAILSTLLLSTGPARAQSVEVELIASGIDSPTAIKSPPDGSGRLFFVSRPGRIFIYDGTSVLPTPFLDIAEVVFDFGLEQGLLSMAFHPDYAQNGYFYVSYTDDSEDVQYVRYTVSPENPDLADPSSAFPILTIPQFANNHNGGSMSFGPDGYLYLSSGDGGGNNPADPLDAARDITQLLGKIHRIDVDSGAPYAIPADNPFVGVAGAREEIWALGLRNPWKLTFDRLTGDMYVGDVGQNSWEELNFEPSDSPGGLNYQWSCKEGPSVFYDDKVCDAGASTPPVLEYTHQEGHCSIIAGYVYRGFKYPQLRGLAYHGDWCTGLIWGGSESAGT